YRAAGARRDTDTVEIRWLRCRPDRVRLVQPPGYAGQGAPTLARGTADIGCRRADLQASRACLMLRMRDLLSSFPSGDRQDNAHPGGGSGCSQTAGWARRVRWAAATWVM